LTNVNISLGKPWMSVLGKWSLGSVILRCSRSSARDLCWMKHRWGQKGKYGQVLWVAWNVPNQVTLFAWCTKIDFRAEYSPTLNQR
jgi:hypothetical protein